MNISELLAPERIRLQTSVSSKKRALEIVGELLSTALPKVSEARIFDALNQRERLGSTGLGQGVALPHGRLEGVDRPVGALLVLEQPVDYESMDRKPVDLIFALLVPAASTDEHLQILSTLAERFSDPAWVEKIRGAQTSEEILAAVDTQSPSFAA
jgi:PTS system nitrogen regulatory IIA component